jgi:hypothetical protein
MKFFISNDIRNNGLLKLIIVFTLVFLFFLWLTNLLLYFKIGFSYQSIVDYYRGSEESFREPKSYLGLLEESHFHFFSMAIILVTLNHLVLFSKIKNVWKLVIILASYLSAFGDICAGWLIRYMSPTFAYLKLGSVIVLQISFAALLVLVLVFLYSGKDNNLRQSKA